MRVCDCRNRVKRFSGFHLDALIDGVEAHLACTGAMERRGRVHGYLAVAPYFEVHARIYPTPISRNPINR